MTLYRLKSIVEDFYYGIKWSIINFFKYFKIVSKMRPWDSYYILMMMKFQIKDLCNNIEKYSLEIDESKLPKIEKMKRVIKLLHDRIEDTYADRCGYIYNATKFVTYSIKNSDNCELKLEKMPGYENYNESEVFEKSFKLDEDEWIELFDILKNDMRGWWD